jgi:hypothetical protein
LDSPTSYIDKNKNNVISENDDCFSILSKFVNTAKSVSSFITPNISPELKIRMEVEN